MKKCFTPSTVTYYLLFLFAILLTSCEKNDNDFSSGSSSTGATLKTTVAGKVTDKNGNILSGVMVKMGSITTVTDARGYFLFVNKDVPKDRLVLIASNPGYFNTIRGKKTQNGDANYINLVMEELPPVVNIQSSTGGVVNIPGGATITFPANSFFDQNGNAYNGQVNVYSRHFSPGSNDFEATIPGGDLLGLDSQGEEQSLYSLGMIEAKLFDNSGINEVKLAPGVTAEIKFPIDPSQSSVALSTIPMWHLDEITGIWQEEGLATKSGNFYIGNVSHFSTWNCDYPGARTDIKGLVLDCENNPLSNAVVTINGFQNVTTDNSGSFTTWVPVGYLIECQVLQNNNQFLSGNSPVQSITALAGQVNIIPTIIVPCATRISGTLKTCGGNENSPGFIYATWNGGARVAYTNTGMYQLYVPENISVNIIAGAYGLEGNTTIITGVQGENTFAPDIELCNAGSFGQNKFTLNKPGMASVTYLVEVDNLTSSAYFNDSSGDGVADNFLIDIWGVTVPGNYLCVITISAFPAYQVGDYFPLGAFQSATNTVSIQIASDMYTSGTSIFNMTQNKLKITDYGVPGGFVSGIFEYDWAIGPVGNNAGTITGGVFSAKRSN